MKKIQVEVSARHIHLTQQDVEKLFGKDYKLKVLKELSQPGMFAAEETVIVENLDEPEKRFERVRIVGPVRDYTQLEISLSDTRKMGLEAPIRASGDIDSSTPFKIIGPKGEVVKEKGLIVAKRHIHMAPNDAKEFGLKDGDMVNLRVGKEGERELIFGDVKARVSDSYKLTCHLDTDEANAACAKMGCSGEIVKS